VGTETPEGRGVTDTTTGCINVLGNLITVMLMFLHVCCKKFTVA
jgi:hypothetical protein